MQTRRPLINGKHRKQTNPIKGRVAFVAAATGVVSTAGATGAAIAHTTDTGISEISLAAEDTPNAEEGAPQISRNLSRSAICRINSIKRFNTPMTWLKPTRKPGSPRLVFPGPPMAF